MPFGLSEHGCIAWATLVVTSTLQVVLSFDLERGNTVVRVDQPAGTRCPLAVVLAKPLDIAGFKESHGLPPMVNTWKNLDSHYPLEAGYVCEQTRHAIVGPLQ